MSELTGIAYTLVTSPRIAESPASVDEVTVQDALDTLSAKQDNIDVIGATPTVDNTVLVSGSGKDDLGGGTSVGITSTFDNLQWAFASDYAATQAGTATGAGAQTLKDTAARFVTNGIQRGAAIINYDDRSIAEVLTVISETELTHRILSNGSNNDWTIGDNYTIHNIVQKNISGGNQVAVDDLGNTISPIFPTAFTQVIITASSSATATSQTSLESGLFNGEVCIDAINGYPGTDSIGGIPIGTRQAPSSNIADTKQICIARGLGEINFITPYTIVDEDLSAGYKLKGDNPLSVLVIEGAANVTNCRTYDMTIVGQLDGMNLIERCFVLDITDTSGLIYEVALSGSLTLSSDLVVMASRSVGQPSITTGSHKLTVTNYSGSLEVKGITGGIHSVGIHGGRLIVDGTGGTIEVFEAPSEIVDNSGGAVTIVDQTDGAKTTEIWQHANLDPDNPRTVTEAGETFGNIIIDITGGDTAKTATRRP